MLVGVGAGKGRAANKTRGSTIVHSAQLEYKDKYDILISLSLLNPSYSDVVSRRVSKTQTGKSTSSNGSYHIYAMPSQGSGTTVTLSNTSSQEHYEFDDNLPHVFQTPYELESASSHYTEPRVQSATLPSQYEIPVSALSTLQSSQVCVCVQLFPIQSASMLSSFTHKLPLKDFLPCQWAKRLESLQDVISFVHKLPLPLKWVSGRENLNVNHFISQP